MALTGPPAETTAMLGPAPTVDVSVPDNRDYAFLLQQTAQVYNQLLGDKCERLLASLLQQKKKYDAECTGLEVKNKAKALEYGVKSQEALNRAQQDAERELSEQHRDYQHKLGQMWKQLEDKWLQEHP